MKYKPVNSFYFIYEIVVQRVSITQGFWHDDYYMKTIVVILKNDCTFTSEKKHDVILLEEMNYDC